jgi:hypothetical protein
MLGANNFDCQLIYIDLNSGLFYSLGVVKEVDKMAGVLREEWSVVPFLYMVCERCIPI